MSSKYTDPLMNAARFIYPGANPGVSNSITQPAGNLNAVPALGPTGINSCSGPVLKMFSLGIFFFLMDCNDSYFNKKPHF